MTDYHKILDIQKMKLLKVLEHLEYSYQKVLPLSCRVEDLDNEDLETWESFAMRFSRVADIFLTRYLRTLASTIDPGFQGTFRDYLNFAEKNGFINNAREWLRIRELRNLIVHEYTDKDLSNYLEHIRMECQKLLIINNYAPNSPGN